MREQHPIDEFFKRELSGAPAEPPVRLRAAVLAEAQRGYRRALWRTRSRMAIALLLILLIPAGYWFVNNGTGKVGRTSVVSIPDGLNATEHVTSYNNALAEVLPATEDVRPGAATSLGAAAHSGAFVEVARPVGGDRERASRTPLPTVVVGEEEVPMHAEVAQDRPAIPTNEHGSVAFVNPDEPSFTQVFASVTLENEDAFRMGVNPVGPVNSFMAGEPRRAVILDAYVLPKGDWWLAPHVSAYAAQHNWQGTSTRLADALNSAESRNPSAALGIMVGRRWRSGFGAGLGVEVEHAEQAYRHIERNTVQEHTVIANMVTLNTTVVAMTYDTLSNSVVREYDAQGLDQRTTVRVPLEVFWHAGVHRWVLGLRVGAMAEINRVHSSSSLVQDVEDGHIYSAALSADAIGARYPTCVTGLIGADLGFALHERWTLLATPHYARGFVPGTQGALQAAPERLGIRFQLCHYL